MLIPLAAYTVDYASVGLAQAACPCNYLRKAHNTIGFQGYAPKEKFDFMSYSSAVSAVAPW